jgi:hypothetical protein
VKQRILLAAAALTLAAAPSAPAATWTQLTSAGGASTDQVALLRTSDGVLHVAWRKPSGTNTQDLLHTTIAPDGKVGATVPMFSGWARIENPALTTAAGGGIRAFWGGIRSFDLNETNQEMNTAVSTDGGASWALQTGSVVPLGGQSYGSAVSATTRPDGTPVIAWAGTLGTWTHVGLDPATPNASFQPPLVNYGYDPGIASNAAGTWMAWYSNATGHLGPHVQQVNGDGSPLGAATQMPGTANMDVGMQSRTPIVARAGGGVYVAYPTGYPTLDSIRVWKVGTSKTTLIDTTANDSLAAITGDAGGRLWVAWKDGTHVLAARSNKAATKWGAAVDAGAPKGAGSLYDVDASATKDGVDLFGNFSPNTQPTSSTFHTRIRPGLTLTAKRKAGTVTVTVTDAGAPVKGAKVKAAGKRDTTDSKGRATLSLKGRATATVTAKGYETGKLKLK